MNTNTLLILGGYGNTGLPLARLLLGETNVALVLAGRNPEKARTAAEELNRRFPGERVTARAADAADRESLKRAFQGMDLVVVASSTSQYARQVAGAALEAGTDYLDVQYSTAKFRALGSLAAAIEKEGRCFITDGGFHPGLPAALVRYAATFFDRMERARVGSVIKIDWKRLSLADSTLDELLAEFNDFQTLVFQQGRWKNLPLGGMLNPITMDFGSEFGRQYGVPMFLEEMRALPEACPGLQDTGFYVGSFNWFVDWLILPVAMVALRLAPHRALGPMGRLMRWGLDTFTRPPYGTLLKVEAEGEKGGRAKGLEVLISHTDGYQMTAIPVAACLLQYLDGSIRKPGLWTQANLVEPRRLMQDMQRMGAGVQVRER